MAKRGKCGISEREDAQVYPNAHSNAARKQDERARWSVVVSLAPEKRLFLNVAGSAYWCDLSSCAISANGHNPF